ncbi:MAG: hypothetical protein ACXVLQ_00940 [Bacteriovorax sp.]
MKSVIAAIILLSINKQLKASELDGIALVTPTPYERVGSAGQTLKSKIKVEVGDLIKLDVVAEVKKKIAPYSKDLSAYFSKPGELDSFVNKIVIDGKNSIIGNELTDAKLTKFYGYLGNKLIGGLADKILNTEGIKDPARRTLWVNKMLTPFNGCIGNSKNSLYDASHCIDALTTSLVPSVGVGLVYELSKDSLTSSLPENQQASFNNDQVNIYKGCMNTSAGTAADVKNCALTAMRSGILKITDIKLSKTINDASSSTAVAKSIKQSVWTGYDQCSSKVGTDKTSKVGLRDQFMNCIDDLVESTGSLLVQDKLGNTPAITSNFTKAESSKLITEQVQYFRNCIEDQKKKNNRINGMIDSDKCAGELRKNVSMSVATVQIRTNASGKMSPKETDALVNNLVKQKFSACLGATPNDSQLNQCIGALTKGATKSIVLSYEKKQIKDQLNANETPSKLKPVEGAFVSCVDKPYQTEDVSKDLNECTKQFALGFARNLGELKLSNVLKSILGTKTYGEQKKTVDGILGKYNTCLDDLKKISMEDGLLDKLATCTNELQRRGTNFVSSTFNTWMSSEQKDAATLMVKNEFASFIPCLGGLIPPSPYSQQMQQNTDSILKPAALLLAQYIEYSPEDAKRSLEDIIKKLSTDLKDVATNPASRKELIDMLYKNGALDQFLKAMVRGKVKEAIDQTPESELPKDLRTFLLNKENFDTMFATKEGKEITGMVMDKILKPLLLEQVSMSSPVIEAGMDTVKSRVIKMLVYSPNFGEQIVKSSIQLKINDMGGITRFFAKALYGSNSLNWDKVRTTENGKAAEVYIRDNILLPKFKGDTLSREDEKKVMAKAEDLVTAAVKNYE